MVGKPRLTPEQREANHRARIQRELAGRKALPVSLDDLHLFETRFSSETVAAADRGDLLVGTLIGNGCRWLVYPKSK